MTDLNELKHTTVIFALSASKGLAQEICDILDLPLGDCKVTKFADGEILVELGESVRGKDAVSYTHLTLPTILRV